MGNYTNFYSVNTDKIKSVWNSKNEELFNNLKTELQEGILDLDGEFELNFNEDNTINGTENILHDIVFGEINHPTFKYLYAYVYELLCKKYGTKIDLGNVGIGMRYIGEVIEDSNSFLPIPIPDDFPFMYSIANSNLEEQRIVFLEQASYIDDDYIDSYNISLTTVINNIFDTVKNNKTSLVLFTY